MVELICSSCGRRTRHREAAMFIKEGWRHFGDVPYCPRCSGFLKNIDHDEYSMALYLLHVLSKRK